MQSACSCKRVTVRQERLSQIYERRVARVIVDDNSHVLAKHYELLPCGRRFRVPKSIVTSISEQINLFKRHSSVCVCVCACANYVNY